VSALDAVYGAPLDGTAVVVVDTDLAPLFAEAHRRLRRRPAGVHRGDGMVEAVGPAPRVGDRWVDPADAAVAALTGAAHPVVLAGPGVVELDAIPGMHALAAAGSLGVLNTWGAKGLFDWRSRHHLATVGLQALDFARGGLAEADLVVATGIDPGETPADWRLAPVLEVDPLALGSLAERIVRPRAEIVVPALRADLARVTQDGWAVDRAPLPPSRVTRHYSLAFGAGGLVAADAGTAGYWVARTLGTSGVGGAQVPAVVQPGFAIACAIVARLLDPGRRVLAAVDRLDGRAHRLLETGERLGCTVAVEVWADDGDRLGADAHAARLDGLAVTGGIATIATDPRQVDAMVEVAGPIVAWSVSTP
jgi:hypothetical protein